MNSSFSVLPKGPHLVPRFKAGHGGVDFLGLRQVNLDLMAECIPGINNATRSIRPYSVMCWIYWRIHRLLQEQKVDSPTEAQMMRFREKVESLFLWGHQLAERRGVPGFLAKPPRIRANKVDLSFDAWKRNADNTSLQAAVQYGPSLSVRVGLGFLQRVEGAFYRVTDRGRKLAEALDDRLRRRPAYSILTDLRSMHASEEDAKDLFVAWRVDSPSTLERNCFRDAFLPVVGLTDDNAPGRRGAIVNLILTVLKRARAPMTQGAIRLSMAYGHLPNAKKVEIAAAASRASRMWLVLQVRQAQRLALESLLAWVEHRILNIGDRRSEQMTQAFLRNLKQGVPRLLARNTPGDALSCWLGHFRKLEDYVAAALKSPVGLCIFSLGEELERAIQHDLEAACVPSFKLLLLVRRFWDWLHGDEPLRPFLSHGRSERLSVEYWARTFDKSAPYPLADWVSLILDNLILSQHFAVASNRFDGGTQRLRIAIEEEGLECLVARPWRPDITPDRLGTTLSLMADSGLIEREETTGSYSAGAE